MTRSLWTSFVLFWALSACDQATVAPPPAMAPGTTPADATAGGSGTAGSSATAAAGATSNNSAGNGINGAPTYACSSQASCPAADLDYIGSFNNLGQLLGTVGTAVDWQFRGVDHHTLDMTTNVSTRNVMVLFDSLPAGSTIVPDPAAGTLANIAHVKMPAPVAAASGNFAVIVRDFDRCMVNESAAVCNQYKLLTVYDKQFTGVPYVINSGAASPTPSGAGAGPGPGTSISSPTSSSQVAATSPATTPAPAAPASSPAAPNTTTTSCPPGGGLFGSIIHGLLAPILGC